MSLPISSVPFNSPADPLNRIGLPPAQRLVLTTTISSFFGFLTGSYQGGQQASVQYLAENAHRLPKTVQGWYFYHKTKNYRVMLGGVKRGMKMGAQTGALVLGFEVLEASVDELRGEADIFGSIIAGGVCAGIFSFLAQLSRQSRKHSLLLGLSCGLFSGGLSDLHKYLKGETPSYIGFLRKFREKM